MLRSLPQNKKTRLSKALKLDGGRERKAAKAKVDTIDVATFVGALNNSSIPKSIIPQVPDYWLLVDSGANVHELFGHERSFTISETAQ